MKKVLLTGIWLVCSIWVDAQDGFDLEAFAEHRFQIQEEDIGYEDLYESLLLYHTNPLNLNTATEEEIGSLYILSPAQLREFSAYRAKQDKLISIYELQAIPLFDIQTIKELLPFVSVNETVDTRPLLERIANEPNNYLLLRYTRQLQQSAGYKRTDGSGFLGDPNTLYGRFRVSHAQDFSLGFTFEKDAGEQLSLNPGRNQYGMDYYSGHVFLQNKGKLKALALGDFQLQFGQGLVFGAGFSAGKGANPIATIKRNTTGVKPYASVLESGFFRGGAATVSLGNLDITVFGSYLQQDANLLRDTTYSDFELFVNSVQATGLHRTPNELAAKNSTNEIALGTAAHLEISPRFSVGATSLYSLFSNPIQKRPTNYNQFEFVGKKNIIQSIYTNYNWQNFMFFGEAARSRSGGIGYVAGLLASLTPQLDLSWSLRNYDKNFHSFYGNAFGESSRNINEKGVYWGLAYKPSRKWQLALYFDKFRFPWLRYRTDAPSEGFEYLARLTYKPKKMISLYAQFRQENKERSISEGNLSVLTETIKRTYLINLDYALARSISFKTRIQASDFQLSGQKSHGLALVQDINLKIKDLKLSGRFAVFDTDDFENRQYMYERDVLYAFSIPAYQGVGSRSYLLAQYRFSSQLTIWARYAQFHFANLDEFGSGLSKVNGNLKSEIKLMARYKFN
ncbi:ComEA family DNA-binding protein [Marinoscillum furvescens]|uniref:Helix-hairpin-helix protein n=1 Tax=Marinoscillum furvescens DSM 4134 TaxID=1122208 RepID=A0A3D9L0V1_MARFU|nr:helix-hairpin-helix domain-containing protein [Marinoscillum furvescens]RED96653.1 helix-hairpin-helix protein [Marinoscillum furvescens DSM 4134]